MLCALLGLLLALPLSVSVPADIGRAPADEQSLLFGRLGGDAQLEGGCVWLDAAAPAAEEEETAPEEAVRHEPLWPEGYYVTFDPVRLWDPEDRLVAEEGDDLTVEGQVRNDVVTICQVGTPYEVHRILTVNGRFIQSGNDPATPWSTFTLNLIWRVLSRSLSLDL